MAQPVYSADFRDRLEDLYNDMRKAYYNREYYGCRLEHFRKWNSVLEIILAIGSSTAIATWFFWKKGIGPDVWAFVTAICTVIAVVKPLLNYSQQIERYSRLFAGHSDVSHDLEQVAREVKKAGSFKGETEQFYQRVKAHWKALDDDPKPSKKLENTCMESINTKYPPNSFWMPE